MTEPSDPRPEVAIGHVRLDVNSLDAACDLLELLGVRPVSRYESFAVLELRGGTHIVLRQDDGAEPIHTEFDFMVEDVDATHAEYAAKGLNVSEISRGRIHDSFTLTEPGGNRITVNSTHVSDQPV